MPPTPTPRPRPGVRPAHPASSPGTDPGSSLAAPRPDPSTSSPPPDVPAERARSGYPDSHDSSESDSAKGPADHWQRIAEPIARSFIESSVDAAVSATGVNADTVRQILAELAEQWGT